ncbi:monocarboxylate transporter 2-like isoform X1 [Mytilus californianus]|uniref:monocarboxylate transporter 2-like isoform X1 n=3 Tax=Mytilus californianus TaxID=6549 RepID=UPI002246D6EB|nr:monocarboxylate transporter 2-like isoform X1 [Mytilus californianus]
MTTDSAPRQVCKKLIIRNRHYKIMTVIKSSTMNKKRKHKVKEFPHPVDSGWSWMVLLASFILFVTFGGILRSFGIYMVEFLTVYNTDSTSSSLIIGLQFATSSVVGFLSMTIGLKFLTPRQVIMTGGFIGSLGLICNTFAQSIYFFIFSHSILVGIAIGSINGPCLFVLGKYFDKRRSLANGITMSGVSFGGLIMGPLSRLLIDTYGLRGAFLIIGGIHFHTVMAGALLRPETFYRVVIKKRNRKISDDKSQDQRTRKISENKNPDQRTRKISDGKNPEHRIRKISDGKHPEHIIRQISDGKNPEQRTRKISDSRKPETKALLEENNDQFDGFRPRSLTGDSFSPLARKAMLQRMRSRTESEIVQVEMDPTLVESNQHISSSQGNILAKFESSETKRRHYLSSEFLYDINTAEIIRSISDESVNKLSKGDATLVRKHSIVSVLRYVFNCAIFRNIAFTLFIIAYLTGSIGCLYPIMFIPPLADFHGIDKTRTSLIISISSVIDIFGRAGSGIFADHGFIGRKHIMIIALIICGIINSLSPFYTEFWSLVLYSVIYGLVGGTMFAINSSTLSEIIEPERFGQAIGLMTGGQHIFFGITGPFNGALRDLTGSYNATFFFFGITNFFGAFLLVIDVIYLRLNGPKKTQLAEIEIEPL